MIIYDTDDATNEQWEIFNNELEMVDLDFMRSIDVDSQVDLLYSALSFAANKAFNVKQKFMEVKNDVKRKFIPNEVRKLLRKKLKLKKKILMSDKWTKNLRVEEELEKVTDELDSLLYNRRLEMENKAINKINKEPAYFYKYQRRFGKVSEPVADLKVKEGDNIKIVTDNKSKADVLNQQYCKMWTEPKIEYKVENSNAFFNNCYDCHKELDHYCDEDVINDNIENNTYIENNDTRPTLRNINFNTESIENYINNIINQ